MKKNNMLQKVEKTVVSAVDANQNGEVDIEDVILLGMKMPGVCIDREKFLRTEFENNYSEQVVDTIIQHNPSYANIPHEVIDKLSRETINFERTCVSGISFALGMPGGWAMAATIPADIVQYYGYTLRAAQKLMYLYGFPALNLDESSGAIDTETMNALILCLGVMNGVAGANNALKALAKCLAIGVEKQLLKKALTKGTIYPIVKKIVKWFTVNLTKEMFAGFFKKAIPVVGGAVGGTLTYVAFKPCCNRLIRSLKQTALYDPSLQDNGIEKTVQEILTDK